MVSDSPGGDNLPPEVHWKYGISSGYRWNPAITCCVLPEADVSLAGTARCASAAGGSVGRVDLGLGDGTGRRAIRLGAPRAGLDHPAHADRFVFEAFCPVTRKRCLRCTVSFR